MSFMDIHFEIRLARPSDARSLAQMSRDFVEKGLGWSWKPERVLAMIHRPETVVLLASTRFEVAGFAIMEFQDQHAHLNLLAVKPKLRRGGTGTALLQWLEESARVAGIASIFLEVRSENTDARNFYESLGYEVNKHKEGYYQGKESAVEMVHHLIAPDTAAQRP